MQPIKPATIYVVATPIGNLGDISARAVQVLKEVDVIAAEDTRQTKRLCRSLGIKTKDIVAYHDHNEEDQARRFVQRIAHDQISLALVTDAGTPSISDPGYRLVKAATRAGIPVVPVPGASAVTTLLSVAGLPSNRFIFVGFLPRRPKALKEEVQKWRTYDATVIFFESLQRLKKTMAAVSTIYPEAEVVIGRELTKIYEEYFRGSAREVQQKLEHTLQTRGEAVVAIYLPEGMAVGESDDSELKDVTLDSQLRALLRRGETLKDILRQFKDHPMPRKDLYRRLLELQGKL